MGIPAGPTKISGVCLVGESITEMLWAFLKAETTSDCEGRELERSRNMAKGG